MNAKPQAKMEVNSRTLLEKGPRWAMQSTRPPTSISLVVGQARACPGGVTETTRIPW